MSDKKKRKKIQQKIRLCQYPKSVAVAVLKHYDSDCASQRGKDLFLLQFRGVGYQIEFLVNKCLFWEIYDQCL